MANRRMFAKTIIDSDMFLDMPSTTQNLYFHLNMRADDEGFVNAPKKVMRVIQANTNDLDILIAKKFVLVFESGVLVIKHWKLHNTIRKDRFTKTLYTEEKRLLFEKENGSYTFTRYENAMKQVSSVDIQQLEEPATNWQPDSNQVTTNGLPSIGKVSIDLNLDSNLEESYKEKNTKKENIPYSPYSNIEEPKDSLSKMITEAVKHWNTKSNLLPCKYTILNLPNISDIRIKFDVFRDGEILQAIDNLSKAYDSIDQTYRPKNFQNFIVNSLDNWFEERAVEPEKRSYRTQEEKRYYMALDMKKRTPESIEDSWVEEKRLEMEESFLPPKEKIIDERF